MPYRKAFRSPEYSCACQLQGDVEGTRTFEKILGIHLQDKRRVLCDIPHHHRLVLLPCIFSHDHKIKLTPQQELTRPKYVRPLDSHSFIAMLDIIDEADAVPL